LANSPYFPARIKDLQKTASKDVHQSAKIRPLVCFWF